MITRIARRGRTRRGELQSHLIGSVTIANAPEEHAARSDGTTAAFMRFRVAIGCEYQHEAEWPSVRVGKSFRPTHKRSKLFVEGIQNTRHIAKPGGLHVCGEGKDENLSHKSAAAGLLCVGSLGSDRNFRQA
jgi:hypothetical protein